MHCDLDLVIHFVCMRAGTRPDGTKPTGQPERILYRSARRPPVPVVAMTEKTTLTDPTPTAPTLPELAHVRTLELVLPQFAPLPLADPDMFELRPPPASAPRDVNLPFDADPIF